MEHLQQNLAEMLKEAGFPLDAVGRLNIQRFDRDLGARLIRGVGEFGFRLDAGGKVSDIAGSVTVRLHAVNPSEQRDSRLVLAPATGIDTEPNFGSSSGRASSHKFLGKYGEFTGTTTTALSAGLGSSHVLRSRVETAAHSETVMFGQWLVRERSPHTLWHADAVWDLVVEARSSSGLVVTPPRVHVRQLLVKGAIAFLRPDVVTQLNGSVRA